MKRILPLFCLLLLLGSCDPAQRAASTDQPEQTPENLQLRLISQGFGIGHTETAESVTETGATTETQFVLDRKTDVIPCKMGTKFGMSFFLEANTSEPLSLTRTWIYPEPLVDDQGRIRTEERREFTQMPNTSDFFLFEFEYPYELKKGVWEFRIYYKSKVMYLKRFRVV